MADQIEFQYPTGGDKANIDPGKLQEYRTQRELGEHTHSPADGATTGLPHLTLDDGQNDGAMKTRKDPDERREMPLPDGDHGQQDQVRVKSEKGTIKSKN